jgi:PAS domain S-box-containing protein
MAQDLDELSACAGLGSDLLRAILADAGIGVALGDLDGRILTVNPALERLLGHTADELCGRGFTELTEAADVAASWDALGALRAGVTERVELDQRYRGKDGALVWGRATMTIVRNREGRPQYLLALVHDITERKLAQLALLEREFRFRTLFADAPVGQVLASVDGTLLEANAAACVIFGCSEEAVIGTSPSEWLHPDDAEAFRADMEALASGALRAYQRMRRFCRADGSVIDVEVSVSCVRDTAGRLRAFIGLLSDVTERREAERQQQRDRDELEQERRFLKAVLENLHEGIVACDANGVLRLFNPATRAFHGLPEEHLPPEAWADYYDLRRADGTPMATEEIPLYRAFSGEQVRDAEIVIAPHDGPERMLLANGEPIVDADGHTLGAVVAMHDVTERKRAEAQLLRYAQELERSNRDLAEFASVVAHDLKSPLQAVAGFSGLLERFHGAQLDERGREFLARIRASVARMNGLIDDLLDYGRIAEGDADEGRGEVDLDAVLGEALLNLDADVALRGGIVTADALPTVWGHRRQLGQLLQNLVGNALKFAAADTPPRVHVSAAPTDAAWTVTVTDNGIGIPAPQRARVFDRFTQLHERGEREGSGIGLAIAQRVVDRHGGRIWVEDAPGGGTRFCVTLPQRAVQPR